MRNKTYNMDKTNNNTVSSLRMLVKFMYLVMALFIG